MRGFSGPGENTKKTTWGGGNKANEKPEEQKKLETQIDAIKKLQSAYNELNNGRYSKQEVKSLIDDYFSWLDASIRDRTDFWAELMEYADKLEQYDKEAAARLRADVARGQAKEVGDANKKRLEDNRKATEKAIKDYESLEKKITEYLSKEYTIEGEKASAKISKMLTDLFNKNVKVELDTEELVHVTVDNEEIVTTPKHPFYVPNKGWISAIDLRAGDILVLSNGEYVIVEKVQHEILESPVKVCIIDTIM